MSSTPPSLTTAVPSSHSNDDVKRSMIGEIQPGLWVGGLSALKELPKIVCNDDYDDDDNDNKNNTQARLRPAWTIVSLVHSEKLTAFCQTAVLELKQTHGLDIIRHVEWIMADKNDVPFLCERLEEVLQAVDQALLQNNNDNNDNNKQHSVLVHCAFGVSRSVSVCAAWLISRQGLDMPTALQRIRAVRPDAMPNMGFLANLRTLEQAGGKVTKAMERKQRLSTSSN